ncbi:endonuclease III [Chelativorans sp. YIM 93263]|uniref:endonuclease III n=1 Tax=Chelativorans sp. YIM 93263 TaxID=2906648 RepID=UPI00237996A9|nr:endonuclease III [Chelativorans sp. YIM 93263]
MQKPKTKKVARGSATASKGAKKPAKPKKILTAYSGSEVEEIFRRFRVQRPEPKGELEHVNPFTLLVAVVLSAQATDAGVNKATRALFEVADTPEKMLALGEEKLGEYIRTIGLWRNKAKNVIALCEGLIREHDGEVPGDRDALTKLPGVGRKTANVVLNMAFGQPTMAVDTHIFRIANRIELAPGKTPDAVEKALLEVIPDEFARHAHHWLILHGRYVCKARKPDCPGCIIADVCKAPEKTTDVPAPLEPLEPVEAKRTIEEADLPECLAWRKRHGAEETTRSDARRCARRARRTGPDGGL